MINLRENSNKYWEECIDGYDKELDPEARYYKAWLVAPINVNTAALAVTNMEWYPHIHHKNYPLYERIKIWLYSEGWGGGEGVIPYNAYAFEIKAKALK